MSEAPQVPAGVDTGRPTPARIYDYMLQGNNYFQVDRFAAEQILKAAPDSILDHPAPRKLIDLSGPVGLLMTGVMMFVSDTSDPWTLVSRYVASLAPGSYLSLSHLTDDYKPPAAAEGFRAVFDTATEHMYFRTRAKVERFFEGLELVQPYEGAEPGVTFTGLWGAEDATMADSDGSRWLYCGVARKP